MIFPRAQFRNNTYRGSLETSWEITACFPGRDKEVYSEVHGL